jgi:hypothetical protein
VVWLQREEETDGGQGQELKSQVGMLQLARQEMLLAWPHTLVLLVRMQNGKALWKIVWQIFCKTKQNFTIPPRHCISWYFLK